jgi:hypothetical protein
MILQHPLVFESIDRYEVCCASLQHFSIVRAFESGSVEQAWLCEGWCETAVTKDSSASALCICIYGPSVHARYRFSFLWDVLAEI